MQMEFTGPVWFWKGPAPWHFVTVPDDESGALEAVSPMVTYGWGMIPVEVQVGAAQWSTALFPKDGRYLVPLKDVVRKRLGVSDGDVIAVELTIGS